LHYDADKDGIISYDEHNQAWKDWYIDKITERELNFVKSAYIALADSINELCPGCYSP
jgi:hypothetical protein